MTFALHFLCIAALFGGANAQSNYVTAPSSAVKSTQAPTKPAPSLCDKYTKALLGDTTAAHQKLLITLVVHTAIIGNYTQPNVGIKVHGILAPAVYNGVPVNLLQYFDGSGYTTNVNSVPSRVNFLDGGGAAPLLENKPAFSKSSNQVWYPCR